MSGGPSFRLNAGGEQKKPALEQYGVDLTQLAGDGKLDPVVGREAVIQRLLQVLSRRTKNNPCLQVSLELGKLQSWRASSSALYREMCLKV